MLRPQPQTLLYSLGSHHLPPLCCSSPNRGLAHMTLQSHPPAPSCLPPRACPCRCGVTTLCGGMSSNGLWAQCGICQFPWSQNAHGRGMHSELSGACTSWLQHTPDKHVSVPSPSSSRYLLQAPCLTQWHQQPVVQARSLGDALHSSFLPLP